MARLDGLPLAIELAAARIRTMSLEELGQRLEDRFAVLRGRDRSAPARHQTLTAVIAWSWDLLTPREQQRAGLVVGVPRRRRQRVRGVGAGPDAMDQVEALVDQSLLAVDESEGVAHYRMLETVREFGTFGWPRPARPRLLGGADRLGHRRWPTGSVADLFGEGQVAAVDELSHEENNLADVLRRAMAEDDADAAVRLMATLGTFWVFTGNNPRVFAVIDATERILERWEPPPELVPATQVAMSILVTHMGFFQDRNLDAVIAAMGGSVFPSSRGRGRRTPCSSRPSRSATASRP